MFLLLLQLLSGKTRKKDEGAEWQTVLRTIAHAPIPYDERFIHRLSNDLLIDCR